jgi:hypothetical protein
MNNQVCVDDPAWALVDVEGGYIVEKFEPIRHMSIHGWSKSGVNLFFHREEVEHLRDQILN